MFTSVREEESGGWGKSLPREEQKGPWSSVSTMTVSEAPTPSLKAQRAHCKAGIVISSLHLKKQ